MDTVLFPLLWYSQPPVMRTQPAYRCYEDPPLPGEDSSSGLCLQLAKQNRGCC